MRSIFKNHGNKPKPILASLQAEPEAVTSGEARHKYIHVGSAGDDHVARRPRQSSPPRAHKQRSPPTTHPESRHKPVSRDPCLEHNCNHSHAAKAPAAIST